MTEFIDLTVESPDELAESAFENWFPDGAVRLTFNRFTQNKRNEHLTFEEIIGNTGDIIKIVLSSYCIDEDWIFDKLRRVPKVIAVTHWDRQSGKPGTSAHPYWPNVSIVRPEFPKFPNFGVMHSKLILIFRPKSLRVVISTGNLVEYDYNEAVYVHDLCPAENESQQQTDCQFKVELERVLNKFGLEAKALKLEQFDWQGVEALLIASEPGYHFSDSRIALGLGALKKLSANWQCNTERTSIEYQCSSLGRFDPVWLSKFFSVATNNSALAASASDKFRIVFPTARSVHQSPLGPGAFGTIFCRTNDWEAPGYPRSSFYSCVSTGLRGRPLHTKVMTIFNDKQPAYFYLGSSNFTPAAWGRYVKDDAKLMICNFELGVLLDPKTHPIIWPYEHPVKPYEKTDLPWIQDEESL